MSHDPIPSESAAASPCMQAPLTQRQKYKITADETNYRKLLAALSMLWRVVVIEAWGNDIKIYRLSGCYDTITVPFCLVCQLLQSKLFYQTRRGMLVNLTHFVKIKGKGRNTRILLANGRSEKLSRGKADKLKKLKRYLESDQFINDFCWQFVM